MLQTVFQFLFKSALENGTIILIVDPWKPGTTTEAGVQLVEIDV
jgi:hypothetical protein